MSDPRLQTYARIGYLLGGRITENLTLLSNRIEQDKEIVLATVNTLKTRRGNNVFRVLPNSPADEAFYTNALTEFNEYSKNSLSFKDYLGLGAKRNIELKFQQQLGIVPHSLRHLRATHMGHKTIPGSLHQPTTAYLKYYFGWSQISMAVYYIDNLTIQDILQTHRSQRGANA